MRTFSVMSATPLCLKPFYLFLVGSIIQENAIYIPKRKEPQLKFQFRFHYGGLGTLTAISLYKKIMKVFQMEDIV